MKPWAWVLAVTLLVTVVGAAGAWAAEEAQEAAAPEAAPDAVVEAEGLLAAGDPDGASRVLEKGMDVLGAPGGQAALRLGVLRVSLGELDTAKNTARTGLALMPRSRDDLSGRQIQESAIIRVFAPSGDVEATVAELDAHLAAGSRWTIEGLLPDPRFDPVPVTQGNAFFRRVSKIDNYIHPLFLNA